MKSSRKVKVIVVLTLLILSLSGYAGISLVSAQSEDERTSTFTTDKGTEVTVDTSLENEGGTTPELQTNKPYAFEVTITLNKLGNDTRDIHDLEFEIEIQTSSILGSGKPVFSAYYFDASTSLDEEGQSKTYDFQIFITGDLEESTTEMDFIFKTKEDVDNAPDPTTEFTGIGYEIKITPGEGFEDISFSGDANETRSINVFSDEGTEVNIEVTLQHEGLTEEKPSLLSGNFYRIHVNFTVKDLGADARDVHDVEIKTLLEDSSITDVIPGSGAVKYFSAYGVDASSMNSSESRIFEFALTPSTNINQTEVDLKFSFLFTEDINNNFDPDSEFSLNIETQLNKDLENLGLESDETETPFYSYAILLAFVALPLVRRYVRNR